MEMDHTMLETSRYEQLELCSCRLHHTTIGLTSITEAKLSQPKTDRKVSGNVFTISVGFYVSILGGVLNNN